MADQKYRIEDIIEIKGNLYEVTHTDTPSNGRKYFRFRKEGACNAMGRVTNEAAIDITEGLTGYAKLINTDKEIRMSFSGARLVERKRKQS
jgi:hypothetical protein